MRNSPRNRTGNAHGVIMIDSRTTCGRRCGGSSHTFLGRGSLATAHAATSASGHGVYYLFQ